ncbi:uncharacterized protein LOC123193611 isoform X2 [Mangifera indica]|uniref:uncharacterized protein LOC123193611 isoform X2 n=1 Tax=Mangifera indica TaxID=29780 RepID=UPI001CFA1668|nr:uncharacterized protein LOC123193611 isoform X2 [Mangifera indica]
MGLVNPRFRMIRTLKESNGPFFFAELIPTFCSDTRTTIRELIRILEKPVVDFHILEELCMKIKGASSCIGAHQIALASGDLFRAVTDKCKERCVVAVDAIKHEFMRLNERLDAVLQLEQKILSHR